MVRAFQTLPRDTRLEQHAHGRNTTDTAKSLRGTKQKRGLPVGPAIASLYDSVDLSDYDSLPSTAMDADLYCKAVAAYLNGGTGRPYAGPKSAYVRTSARRSARGAGTIAEILVGFAAEIAGLDVDPLHRSGDLVCDGTVVEVKASWRDQERRTTHLVNIPVKQFAESEVFVIALFDDDVPGVGFKAEWFVMPSEILEAHVYNHHDQPANPDKRVVSFSAATRRHLSAYRADSLLEVADRLAELAAT